MDNSEWMRVFLCFKNCAFSRCEWKKRMSDSDVYIYISLCVRWIRKWNLYIIIRQIHWIMDKRASAQFPFRNRELAMINRLVDTLYHLFCSLNHQYRNLCCCCCCFLFCFVAVMVVVVVEFHKQDPKYHPTITHWLRQCTPIEEIITCTHICTEYKIYLQNIIFIRTRWKCWLLDW